jgi:hypothetical protein
MTYQRKGRLEGMTPDQVARLREVVAARRGTHRMEVEHAIGCPCVDGQLLDNCTCSELDVVLERLQ